MKRSILCLAFLLVSSSYFSQVCEEGFFTMSTQLWGYEVSWTIQDANGNLVYLSQDYNSFETTTETVCLEEGCYLIHLQDSFGDGWNQAILIYTDSQGLSTTYSLPSGNSLYLPISFNGGEDCDTSGQIFGCTDSTALNYNPLATINDGSCTYPQTIYGCTDPEAANYNPWATVDSGTCYYPLDCDSAVNAQLYVCVFSNGGNIGFELIGDNGDIVYSQFGFNDFAIDYIDICLQPGVCYTASMYNTAGPFGWYNGYFWVAGTFGDYVQDALYPGEAFDQVTFSIDGTCGDVFGCTDSTSVNYNPLATLDDGSCYYPAENDLCADALPIQPGVIQVDNSGAYLNEGIWGECWNSGGGEGEQTSVWFSFATPDVEDFRIILEAVGDGTFSLTDTQFGVFESCGGEMIACDGNGGFGLFSRLEFECGDLQPNTTYLLVIDGWFGDAGTCLLEYNVIFGCEDPVYGCTDPEALNYNPLATADNGSCVYLTDSCDYNAFTFYLNTAFWGNEVSFSIIDDQGNMVFLGSGFSSNSDYTMALCLEDGCYTLNLEDSFGDGWNGAFLTIYWNGVVYLENLTIPQGNSASFDFGVNSECSDTQVIFGCTDPLALNYNPLATVNDGSCQYEQECQASWELLGIDEEGDVVYLANTSYGENLTYFWDFGDGTTSTDQFPLHQYLEDGVYIVCLTVQSGNGGFLDCVSTYCDSITYWSNPVIGGSGESTKSNGGFWLNVGENTPLGLSDVTSDRAFKLFPVPSGDELNIVMESFTSESLSMRVLDLSGKVILEKAMNLGVGEQVFQMDISFLSEGSYLLEITGSESRGINPFVILR
jgi:hypothetical protein